MRLATNTKGTVHAQSPGPGFEDCYGNMQVALRLPKPAFRVIDRLAASIGASRAHTIRLLIDAGLEAHKEAPEVAAVLRAEEAA